MNILGMAKGLLTGDVLDTVKDLAGKFVDDPVQQATFEIEMEKVLQARESEIEQTLRQRMTMTQEVIKAEMQQGDTFTKRARPMLVYWGMALITVSYLVGIFRTVPPLPDQFWLAWGGVVSVWIAGRSAEKFRGKGKTEDSLLLKAING
tara:strand:+ start:842 stop:1288 length:447 start_codon:yes stop_codon:yes gene_type:complete